MSIILPNGGGGGEQVGGLDLGNSYIGWNNLINALSVSSLVDPANLGFLYDNMTSLYWNAGVGTVDLDINFSEVTKINWVGVANGNWQSASTTIEIYVGSDTNKIAELSGLRDGDPMMWVFDEVEVSFVRIRFISDGVLKVGEAGTGLAIKLPCLPDIGLMLGKFNNEDKILGKKTEDDIFAATSVIRRSRKTMATYSTVPIAWARLYWVIFSNNHKGKLVWFAWDNLGAPFDISFGHWTANNISYTKSTYTTINFTVIGDAR